jgi:hypothetical protein
MKTRFSSHALVVLAAYCLAACTVGYHEAHNGQRSEINLIAKLGGTAHQQGANGYSITTDDQASFQQGVQAAGVAFGQAAVASVNKAQQVTAQVSSANAARTAQTQINATASTTNATTAADAATAQATIAARAAATSEAIKAAPQQIQPITVTAP